MTAGPATIRPVHYRLDANGNNIYGVGIDLNRSFPYRYQSRSDGRNY